MSDTLISRLANAQAISAERLPAVDVQAIDDAIAALAGARRELVRAVDEAVAAERERAARVCDDEARIRLDAAAIHPEGSDSRGRCNAAARAAINCAKGVRNGEVVGP